MQTVKSMFFLIALLSLGSCANKIIHQGNVIDPDNAWIIQEGDTRFAIESEIGSPTINDASYPKRAVYIDHVFNEETEESYTRSIEIIYDEAWRVKSIRRVGFE